MKLLKIDLIMGLEADQNVLEIKHVKWKIIKYKYNSNKMIALGFFVLV